MAERTTGIRALLSLPPSYLCFQRLVGDHSFRTHLADAAIRPSATDRVLDLGCGPGVMRDYVQPASYVGVDPSVAYINSARRRYGDDAEFLVGDTGSLDIEPLRGQFSVALAIGVLHHLADDQVADLAVFARAALGDGGRFITVDPCLVEGQNRIARAIILRDRGQNVRTEVATKALLTQTFSTCTTEVRHDLLRIPYTHVVTVSP